MPTSDTLVVIPAWNEEATVGAVVSGVRRAGLAVLVVDDGSSDATARVAADAGATVVSLAFNMGVGGALRCGFKAALRLGYRAVVQCDADGQHPAEHIVSLIETADHLGADMVIGSRFADGAEPHMTLHPVRRLAMWALSHSASVATGGRVSDTTSGFRVIRGKLLEQLATNLPSYYLGDTYEALIAAGRAGYKVIEIPAPIVDRVHGASSATTLRASKYLFRAFVSAALRIHCHLDPS